MKDDFPADDIKKSIRIQNLNICDYSNSNNEIDTCKYPFSTQKNRDLLKEACKQMLESFEELQSESEKKRALPK
jgi:hypothetical protein